MTQFDWEGLTAFDYRELARSEGHGRVHHLDMGVLKKQGEQMNSRRVSHLESPTRVFYSTSTEIFTITTQLISMRSRFPFGCDIAVEAAVMLANLRKLHEVHSHSGLHPHDVGPEFELGNLGYVIPDRPD